MGAQGAQPTGGRGRLKAQCASSKPVGALQPCLRAGAIGTRQPLLAYTTIVLGRARCEKWVTSRQRGETYPDVAAACRFDQLGEGLNRRCREEGPPWPMNKRFLRKIAR